MIALYLIIHTVAHQCETMLVRKYGRKYGSGGMFFNGVICLFATIFFIFSDTDGFHFSPGIWQFGVVNALLYAAGFYFVYVAFKTGQIFITQKITSMSFIFPILYGIIFLNEKANVITYCVIILCIISAILMSYKKREPSQEKQQKKVTAVWLIATLITLFSNGFISIVAKEQQKYFGGLHSNEYMIVTLSIASAFLFVFGFIAERKNMKTSITKGSLYGIGAGLLNGVKNAVNLALIMAVPFTILSPLQKAIGIPVNFLVAFFFYKERYTKLQYFAIILSVFTIVLMQINK